MDAQWAEWDLEPGSLMMVTRITLLFSCQSSLEATCASFWPAREST
jgi:hypothetical protein